MRVLVVDNFDSFVYNLVHYLAELGAEPEVWRNDQVPMERLGDFDGVLLSPGPGTPAHAGCCGEVVRRCAQAGLPLLGVCLGMQVLAEVYGGTVGHAPQLLHGKTSRVNHDGAGVLESLPNPFTATRYHSLTVLPETIPADLRATAETADGVVMGLSHRALPLHGVQFHPESVLTEGGHRMLANWMRAAGHPVPQARVAELEQGMRALAAAAG